MALHGHKELHAKYVAETRASALEKSWSLYSTIQNPEKRDSPGRNDDDTPVSESRQGGNTVEGTEVLDRTFAPSPDADFRRGNEKNGGKCWTARLKDQGMNRRWE